MAGRSRAHVILGYESRRTHQLLAHSGGVQVNRGARSLLFDTIFAACSPGEARSNPHPIISNRFVYSSLASGAHS
jgi:hypothetical protein